MAKEETEYSLATAINPKVTTSIIQKPRS